jgi:hypothetical protein
MDLEMVLVAKAEIEPPTRGYSVLPDLAFCVTRL